MRSEVQKFQADLLASVAISPVLLGSGERLFEGVNLPALGYACVKHEATARATHLILSRR
jgi:hypothetical protein